MLRHAIGLALLGTRPSISSVCLCVQDKYGRPVYIELLGKIDCVKMLEVTTQEKILK